MQKSAQSFQTGDVSATDQSGVGPRILEAREALGLTAAQLARRFGIKTETLRRWENGRSQPRSNRLQLLAGLLGVSLVWLLAGQGEGPVGRPDETEGDALIDEIALLRSDASRMLQRIEALGDKVGRLAAAR